MPEKDSTYLEPVHESAAVLVLRVVSFQLCLAIAAAIVVGIFAATINTSSNTGLLSLALDATIAVLLIIDAIFITGLVIQWAHHRYIITPNEVIVDSGVMQIQRRMYKTDEIKSLELHQPMLGKLFNYGTISFYSPGFREGVQLVNIPNPNHYMQLLSKDQIPAPAADPSPRTIMK